jgi:enterochelin esterase family protein
VDQDQATFFFWDDHPAEEVYLQHWVWGLPSRVAFQRIPHTDAFYLPLPLPKNARVEYKFEVVRGGRGFWTRDPRNPRQAFDPFGSNSVCPASGYEEPEWTREDTQSRKGELRDYQIQSRVFRDTRKIQVYVPAEARPGKRYPLLMVHDGHDFLHFGGMTRILDNLIHRHEVEPLLVCFTNGHARNREYAANPIQAEFLAKELLPFLTHTLPVREGTQNWGLMGASFGAVSSLFAAMQYPDTWGRLLLQSGSFAFTDIGEHERGPLWDPIVAFVNSLRENPPRIHARIYQSCGTFESLIYYNRSLYPIFQKVSDGVHFTEAPDGHNWINWRDRLREGLTFLFPGPLWMYYE